MSANQKRRKSAVWGILLALIFALQLPTQALAAETSELEPAAIITVATGDELIAALASAEDGSTITVMNDIAFEGYVNLGSAEKTVTLQRGTADTVISFVNGDAEIPSTVVNIIFDGNDLDDNTTGSGFVDIAQSMTFENCQFQNCPRSCAVFVTEAFIDIEFTGCIFKNNHNIWGSGGHISVGNAANITLDHCRLENGSAENSGGAINLVTNASCLIRDSVITGNETKGLGGGICALDSSNTVSIINSQVYHNKASQGSNIAAGVNTVLNFSDTYNADCPEFIEKN